MKIPGHIYSAVNDFIKMVAEHRCKYHFGAAWDSIVYNFRVWYGEFTFGSRLMVDWLLENELCTVGSRSNLPVVGEVVYISPTAKFYYEFVLPIIIADKERMGGSWLSVLILDSARKEKYYSEV